MIIVKIRKNIKPYPKQQQIKPDLSITFAWLTPVEEVHFVFFIIYLDSVSRQNLSRLSVAKRNAWRETGRPPHLGLLRMSPSKYEATLYLAISKTAVIQTRPFDSAQGYFLRFYIFYIQKYYYLVGRQNFSRPK